MPKYKSHTIQFLLLPKWSPITVLILFFKKNVLSQMLKRQKNI